jgi:hypothetical protein
MHIQTHASCPEPQENQTNVAFTQDQDGNFRRSWHMKSKKERKKKPLFNQDQDGGFGRSWHMES